MFIVSVTRAPADAESTAGANLRFTASTNSDCGPAGAGTNVAVGGGGGGGGGDVSVAGTGVFAGGTGVSVGGTGVSVGADVGVAVEATRVDSGALVALTIARVAWTVAEPVAVADGEADSDSPPHATASRRDAPRNVTTRDLTSSKLDNLEETYRTREGGCCCSLLLNIDGLAVKR